MYGVVWCLYVNNIIYVSCISVYFRVFWYIVLFDLTGIGIGIGIGIRNEAKQSRQRVGFPSSILFVF